MYLHLFFGKVIIKCFSAGLSIEIYVGWQVIYKAL